MPRLPLSTPISDEKDRHLFLARFVLGINLCVLGAALLLTFIFFSDHLQILVTFSFFLVLSLVYILIRFKYIRIGGYLLIISAICAVCLDTVYLDKSIASSANAALALIVPFAMLLLPKKEAIVLILLIPLYVFSFFMLDQTGIYWPTTSSYLNLIEIVTTLSLFGLSFYFAIQWALAAQLRRVTEIEYELERLYENVPIGLFRTTVDGAQVKANRTLWQLEGYLSEQESVEDSFDIATEWYVDPDRREQFIEEMQSNDQVVDFESEIYHRKTGQKLWISESAYAIKDKNGEIIFFEGSVLDITNRKKVELQLREQSDRLTALTKQLRGITDSARDVIVICNREGVISFANPATKDVFGYEFHEVLGKKADIFIEDDEKEAFWQLILNSVKKIESKPNNQLKINGVKKNGEKLIAEMALARSNHFEGKSEFIGIIRDITEKEKTAEFLSHMQRLDSLGMLAGGIAHDFNNLLVAILSQTSLAMRKLPKDSLALPNLEKAKGAGDRAAELCRQLLAYSGKGHFEIQQVNLSELITKNIHLQHIAIPDNVELITRLAFDVPRFLGDPSQLQQVIMNLLINAVDSFEGESGEIYLTTEQRKIEMKDSLIWTRSGRPLNPGSYVVLHVTDNGRGMDKETQDRIFDPFFTTKPAGHGLGLAGVQGIVRGHNGGILVHSKLGKGTTFSIYFPELIPDELSD